VNQNGERPDEIESLLEIERRGIRRRNEERLLVLETSFRQFLPALIEDILSGLDTDVVAGLKVID
jgi:hypothetical protein